MSSSHLIRWAGLAAMLAGVAGLLNGLVILANPDPPPGSFARSLVDGSFFALTLLVVVALAGLHALQGEAYGRIGRAGLYTVVAASAAQILGGVVSALGSEALLWLVFPVGILGVVVGFVLYGAATLQARVLPRWCGVGLIVAYPATIALGGFVGAALLGLLWLAVGYMLWSRRGTAAEQPSRVS